ncbi:hypothetical protein BGY98DRAFT_955755 [Russula aff. rugulosa BPL654]|nr:hypothetical protein BGY98DRAFT_955755 [Russula aff. rugulosa BPL654]
MCHSPGNALASFERVLCVSFWLLQLVRLGVNGGGRGRATSTSMVARPAMAFFSCTLVECLASLICLACLFYLKTESASLSEFAVSETISHLS